jgi:hypothetical protein
LLLTLLTLQRPAAKLLLSVPQACQLTLPGQRELLLTLLTLQSPAATLLLSLPQASQLTLPGQRVLLLRLLTLQRSPVRLPISPPQAFQRRPPSQPALFLMALMLQLSLSDLLRRPRLQLTLSGRRVLLLRLLTLQRSPATLPISPPQAFQRRPPSQPALFLTPLMLQLSLSALLRRPRLQLTLSGQRVLLLRLLTLQRSPATLLLSPSQVFQRRL